jgi:hypothetical protein
MNLADDFAEDCKEMKVILCAAAEALKAGESEDVAHSRIVAARTSAFVTKWKAHAGVAAIDEALRECDIWAKSSRNHLEEIFLVNQVEVLQTRGNWLLAEGMLKQDVKLNEAINSWPEMRHAFESIYRQQMGVILTRLLS